MAHPRVTNSLSSTTPAISLFSNHRNPNNPKKPFVLVPIRSCPCRPHPSQSLILHKATPSSFFFSNCKPLLRFTRRTGSSPQPRVLGQAEPEQLPQSNAEGEDVLLKPQVSQLRNRIVFGLGIGITAGGVVLAGGWVFAVAMAAVVFAGAREYFELVRSRGITEGMTPPPRYVSRVCSVTCALLPLYIMYRGHIDVSVTSAAFVLAMALLLQRGTIGATWPVLLGGQAHWTVGLVATLISISSIIAADTFAFLGGKVFGRTPLTSISPKKTWEGTIIGFCGCIVTSVVLSKIFSWPMSLSSSIILGVLNFFGSVFGDLTESMIKRDAGVKDSGSLIPGHGGVLDRVDSYVFTGALAYSFVKTFLPVYGV
ncbi:Phosphatidate cytidylyltransferase 4, chloroplastic [Stylosanthes scabra]|uniref:Phosphatidate cytidylyltransferase n=1 Tax=Stylosanthes scabra TaxID=79078 RepID=A0ABU6TLC4_9FABA|nr:Phosphatidate cytidylyltransferase 4, chloroplastic [Stylosanthes scabra]